MEQRTKGEHGSDRVPQTAQRFTASIERDHRRGNGIARQAAQHFARANFDPKINFERSRGERLDKFHGRSDLLAKEVAEICIRRQKRSGSGQGDAARGLAISSRASCAANAGVAAATSAVWKACETDSFSPAIHATGRQR